jgi:hypothetical protein
MSDKTTDAATSKQPNPLSSALSDFVHQHQLSSQRDHDDAANDLTYPATDKAARNTIQGAVDVDNQILALARNGKPIPQGLIDQALKAHSSTTADARRDRSGDNDALAQDSRDVKSEQGVINSDNALLRTAANLTPEVRQMLQQDIASKRALIANEQQDAGNEGRYIKHDIAEIASNDRVAKALKGNRADLVPALEASLAAKTNTALDRGEDAGLEPKYASADQHDQQINEMLLAALKDKCIYHNLLFGSADTGAQAPKKPG